MKLLWPIQIRTLFLQNPIKMSLRLLLSLVVLTTITSCFKKPKVNIEPPFDYTLTGKGDTVLVFVHGLAINKTYWDQQIEAFKDRYTIISFDLPGHGASNVKRNSYGIDDYANDVIELTRSLNLNKIVLIGHSMAGNIDLLAYQHLKNQVIGFIGVDNFQELNVPMSDSAKLKIDEQLQGFYDSYKTTARGFAESMFSPQTDSAVRKRVTNDFVNADSLMVTQLLNSIIDISQNEREQLKNLRVPLVLIDSDMFPVHEDQLEQNCGAGYKIFTIKGSGHFPMVEKPVEFNNALTEALDYIRSPRK